MIQITCTSCKTALEVDVAFAGGVCRCSHCGAIQTVPAADDTRAVRPKPKTLYRKQGQAVVGSGLDELAQVVASSGLASARHRSPRLPSGSADAGGHAVAASGPAGKKPPPWMMLAAAAAMVAAVVSAAVVWWSLRSPAPPGPNPGGSPPAPTGAAKGPAFAGIDLSPHRSVVFLLDRGTSSAGVLSPLKVATLRAAASLGPQRQFAIAFWSAGETRFSYPSTGLAFCVDESLSAARRAMQDIMPFGQTDALPALQAALAAGADAVVIVTAKGFDLDDGWAGRVLRLRSASPSPEAVLHALSIGEAPQSDGLRRVAERTGGRYVELSPTAVRELGSE